jgi:hypothetical protein
MNQADMKEPVTGKRSKNAKPPKRRAREIESVRPGAGEGEKYLWILPPIFPLSRQLIDNSYVFPIEILRLM